MSGSGRADNGHGNSRRHLFRRRNKDSDVSQVNGGSGRGSVRNESLQKGSGGYSGGNSGGNSAVSQERRSQVQENQGRQNRGGFSGRDRAKASFIERPRWVPPKMNTDPLPAPDCPWCGKPIRDISSAIADKDTGAPVHFDCVAERIAGGENFEKGDVISYIGGGRFGIVNFGTNPESSGHRGEGPRFAQDSDRRYAGSQQGNREFTIKKIIEWENRDKRAEWRSLICDHYSIT